MSYFNEIYSSDGQVRPHYAGVIEHWQAMTSKDKRGLQLRSKKFFSGDYAQDPLPRVLTQIEFQILSRGVEQRARAILAFLQDYCAKGTRWNRVMPANTLHSMIARHHSANTLRKLRPDQIAFPYGPDIIRDSAGHWKVVEDSAGIIGGMGDLVKSHKILYQLVPRFREVLADNPSGAHDPLEFFSQLAEYFSQKAADRGGIPLLYLRAQGDEVDQETRRLAQSFAKFGIGCTTASNHLRRIQIKEGKDAGIYLRSSGATERVGALIFHAGPEQLNGRSFCIDRHKASSDHVYLKKLVQSFVRALETPSLETALLDGHSWTNFSPGVQFANDKIFGLYVDKMIRRLLKETPILESIPARPIAVRSRSHGWRLDGSIITKLRRDKNRYVVKQVDEDGGTGVWIGQKESKKTLTGLVEKLRADPQKYIIQEFEHLSVLENRIVDLRLHAHVDAERIIVSNTPWGRANWIHGNGKVNIGSNGFTSPVVVMRQ